MDNFFKLLVEWFLSIFKGSKPPNLANPFDIIWSFWLDLYETFTTLTAYFFTQFTIGGVTTSLYEMTFNFGLIMFLWVAVIATVWKIAKELLKW